jgi:CubicO group peptidase (beta-lactamase class C family)
MTNGSSSGANLSNWRTLPFSRWAFQNVGEIIPCAGIECAPGNSQPLAFEPRSLDCFRLASQNGSVLSLTQFQATTATDALVVLLDGKVVYEFYDHGMTQHTPHILMSASKSIVGLLIGILQRDNAIDLEAQVADLLPEIADTAYRGATLRQLLDMRAGVVFDADELRTYQAATGWDPVAIGERPTDLRWFFANTVGSANPHGGPFRYLSANTDLVGWAIERATGKRFAALVSELICKPMGAEHGASITLDRKSSNGQGLPRCTGGICATARDLARIGQLMVQGGRRADQAIIPSEWIDDIVQNGDRQAWSDGEWAKLLAYRSMSYRSGWYVIDDAPKMLFAMGIHGQNLFVDRANRLVIAKLSSQGAPIDLPAWTLTHRAVAEIRRCLLGRG